MKVVCLRQNGGSLSVRNGWCKAFRACGHQFVFWEQDKKPIFDVFYEEKPDLFIGTTYDLDEATIKILKKHPETKVILFASAFGDVNDIDTNKFPIDMAKPPEVRLVEKLKKETGRPDYVFLHCVESKRDYVLGAWEKVLGIKTVSILNGADTFEYLGGEYKEELACDIGYVGGYLFPYKSRNINPFLLPICNWPNYNFKIFGYGPWPVSNFLGSLDQGWEKHLFKSSKVCPSISEPHSTEQSLGYDIVERNFKPQLSDGFVISDWVEGINETFGKDVIPMAKTPQDFHEMIDFYLKNDKLRQEYSQKQKSITIKNHTYFDRISLMLRELNLIKESEECLTKKTEVVMNHL